MYAWVYFVVNCLDFRQVKLHLECLTLWLQHFWLFAFTTASIFIFYAYILTRTFLSFSFFLIYFCHKRIFTLFLPIALRNVENLMRSLKFNLKRLFVFNIKFSLSKKSTYLSLRFTRFKCIYRKLIWEFYNFLISFSTSWPKRERNNKTSIQEKIKISTHKKKLLEIGKKSIFPKFQSLPVKRMRKPFSSPDQRSTDGEANGKKGTFCLIL